MANAGQRESSFMFSLNELARMEEERVAREAAEERARKEAAARARREAEERSRADEEAKRRAAEEAQELLALRAREEAARLEATKIATVEAARAAVAEGARAAELDRQRKNELNLAQVKGDRQWRRLRGWLVGVSVSFVVAVAAMLAIYAGVLAPRSEARVAGLVGEGARQEDLLRDLTSKLSASEGRVQALEREVADARAENAELERKLESHTADPQRHGHVAPPSGAATTTVKRPPPSKGCANPFDPMCGDLQ
jgi:colicin import membrane protein